MGGASFLNFYLGIYEQHFDTLIAFVSVGRDYFCVYLYGIESILGIGGGPVGAIHVDNDTLLS